MDCVVEKDLLFYIEGNAIVSLLSSGPPKFEIPSQHPGIRIPYVSSSAEQLPSFVLQGVSEYGVAFAFYASCPSYHHCIEYPSFFTCAVERSYEGPSLPDGRPVWIGEEAES